MDCRDGGVGVQAGVYFNGACYVTEDESTSKEKYHTVRDKMEHLTESEIGEITSCIIEYMEGVFKELVKEKVEEIKEKRLLKTKGKTERVIR